ncbi:phage tail protein [Campylobacter sp. MIT 99-7217]|uniref:phage tail sheath family protein n=1 Tax=Campylobacter sp. MIT 99-7217 TaxID=535091 RepID=UPI001157381C|nr:phage tail sheath subtilisin-like domain-containing protein [Campylobacter sp. MIT 99-7217]TQR29327.1 phage tail protein [Campylobacter sp. MIT 99-7217]
MAADFGVNVNITNEAASPISVQSDTPIGIAASIKNLSKKAIYEKAGFSEIEENPIFAFTKVEKAKAFVADLIKEQNLSDFRLYDSLTCIEAQGVNCVIVLSFFIEEADDDINACINAINAFKNAVHRTGFKPDLIIAPYYSHEAPIKAALESVASKLKITAITDLYATSTGEALNAMKAYSSKRLIACWPFVQIYSSTGYKYVPQSPIIAAMIAATDASEEYGFSNSYSNRVLQGVTGVEYIIDFELGEQCDANTLRKAHISTVILYEGFRSWGGETSDQDSIWQDLARVRIFDRISIAAQKASFKAVDKKASELYFVKLSVEELLRALKGAKVLVGYEVSWNEELNTAANVSAGKFYLDIKMMNNPIVKLITLEFAYTDDWADELLNTISGE